MEFSTFCFLNPSQTKNFFDGSDEPKLYHLEQSQLRDQFSINESGELTNHIDLKVETARDGIACIYLRRVGVKNSLFYLGTLLVNFACFCMNAVHHLSNFMFFKSSINI